MSRMLGPLLLNIRLEIEAQKIKDPSIDSRVPPVGSDGGDVLCDLLCVCVCARARSRVLVCACVREFGLVLR